jgi:hypothetical protein
MDRNTKKTSSHQNFSNNEYSRLTLQKSISRLLDQLLDYYDAHWDKKISIKRLPETRLTKFGATPIAMIRVDPFGCRLSHVNGVRLTLRFKIVSFHLHQIERIVNDTIRWLIAKRVRPALNALENLCAFIRQEPNQLQTNSTFSFTFSERVSNANRFNSSIHSLVATSLCICRTETCDDSSN